MANGELPDLEEFCLKVPLYRSYKYSIQVVDELSRYFDTNLIFDCYCIDCKKISVFRSTGHYEGTSIVYYDIYNNIYKKSFSCSRNSEHINLVFLFKSINNIISKIGQYPSMADLTTPELQKYRKILGEDLYREFNRAVRLVSHDIGIGAFVYLRRIFEKQIEEAHEKAKKSGSWNEEEYEKNKKWMDQRIKSLSKFLPKFLVENKDMYAILSKGIHELSEEECLDYFHIVKDGIEMILEEKITEKEKMDRKTKTGINIKKIHEKLKGKEEGK